MRQPRTTWLAAMGLVLALSACDDEIVDVDLPKDAAPAAAPDGARDGAKEGSINGAAAPDSSPPDDTEAPDGGDGGNPSNPDATEEGADDAPSEAKSVIDAPAG